MPIPSGFGGALFCYILRAGEFDSKEERLEVARRQRRTAAPGEGERVGRAAARWEADRALVRRCLQGEHGAWDTLIRRYRRLIYSVPVAYGLSPDQADEIFQRVALKLLEHLERLRRVEGLASWLTVTARRECFALRRAASRWEGLDDRPEAETAQDPPDMAHALLMIESEHALALAMEAIDDPCRRLLEYLYLEDPTPSYKDIAKRLGRPVGSLGPSRARCLGKLRKLYQRFGGREPWSAADEPV